jgi:hypothetical protein
MISFSVNSDSAKIIKKLPPRVIELYYRVSFLTLTRKRLDPTGPKD